MQNWLNVSMSGWKELSSTQCWALNSSAFIFKLLQWGAGKHAYQMCGWQKSMEGIATLTRTSLQFKRASRTENNRMNFNREICKVHCSDRKCHSNEYKMGNTYGALSHAKRFACLGELQVEHEPREWCRWHSHPKYNLGYIKREIWCQEQEE